MRRFSHVLPIVCVAALGACATGPHQPVAADPSTTSPAATSTAAPTTSATPAGLPRSEPTALRHRARSYVDNIIVYTTLS